MDFNVDTATRAAVMSYAERLDSGEITDPKYTTGVEVWQKWAKRRRAHRTLEVLLHLIRLAEHLEKTTYFGIGLLTTHSQNERTWIIKAVGRLCIQNNWPPYTSLIERKDGTLGPGFYKDYGVAVVADDLLEQIKKQKQDECFNTVPPSAPEIMLRVLEFSIKEKL